MKEPNRTNGIKASGKTLLRNVIRHTDTHNRLREEAEMWQLHNKLKGTGSKDREDDDRAVSPHSKRGRRDDRRNGQGHSRNGGLDIHQSFLYDDRTSMSSEGRRHSRSAHMDEEASGSRKGTSTFWMRELEKAEAQDPDRWGHSGYRELYPDDFDSDKSEEKSRSERKNRSKSSKRKKDRDSSLEIFKSKKRRHGSSHKSKRKKHRERKASSGDSYSDSDLSSREEEKKRKKEKKKKKKRRKRSKYTDNRSESGSGSENEEMTSRHRSKFVNEREL